MLKSGVMVGVGRKRYGQGAGGVGQQWPIIMVELQIFIGANFNTKKDQCNFRIIRKVFVFFRNFKKVSIIFLL